MTPDALLILVEYELPILPIILWGTLIDAGGAVRGATGIDGVGIDDDLTPTPSLLFWPLLLPNGVANFARLVYDSSVGDGGR